MPSARRISLLIAPAAALGLAVAIHGDDDDMMSMGGDVPLDFDEPITPEQLQFFEEKIRPVLVNHCYGCHSDEADRVRGGLKVDSRGAIREAIVPGDPSASVLLESLSYEDEFLQMPPRGKLPDYVVDDFERWIAMGAPDPRTTSHSLEPILEREFDMEIERQFWSFVHPAAPVVPDVRDASWPQDDIDRFILADLEAHGLKPVRDADKATLIRRVTFDLTGLPPTPEQVEAFVEDRSDDAYERLVDRLLESQAYGERWGRHWLDVARYGESSGKETNVFYPHAWRYRDYVIDSFNEDKAFDDFLREQIAGDLLPFDDEGDRAEHIVATGFLAIGSKSHNTRGRAQFALDVADEQIDTMSQGMLGLTVSCARCHDHKFDPITSEDYYAMAGIFLSTETYFGTMRTAQNRQTTDLIPLPDHPDVPEVESLTSAQYTAIERQLDRVNTTRERLEADLPSGRNRRQDPNFQRVRALGYQRDTLASILSRYDDDGTPTDEGRVAMGVRDRDRPIDARLLVRGEIEQAAHSVARGFPEVLCSTEPHIAAHESGRLALAEWIGSDDNPLTARVWVNRVWLHLFGSAIVPTPDNFGHSGVPPKHPELLDHLAVRFMEGGWSTKAFVRDLVLSSTYRMSSDHHTKNYRVDPDNDHHWRMSPQRLEAESIRDAMLMVSGSLDRSRPAGSPIAPLEGGMAAIDRGRGAQLDFEPPIRSVYLPIVRDRVPEPLAVFDFAEPSFVTGDREETNVPTQALFLLNSEFVMEQSLAMADRVLASPGSDVDRVRYAFQLAYGRDPSTKEMSAVKAFFDDFVAAQGTGPQTEPPRRGNRRGGFRRGNRRTGGDDGSTIKRTAWAAFCQSLFASAEFRYVG